MTRTETIPESPSDLVALIDYQEASIVSRTLVKGPGGSVTLFAFDAGESLSEHTAPFDVLLHVLDGQAAVTVAAKRHPVAAGQVIPLPADVPHAVAAEERFKMLLIMLRGAD